MKALSLASFAALAAGLAFGEAALDPDFAWSTGDVVIPADTIVEVTDIATVNACASLTIDAGGVLRLNTSAAPANANIKGAGTIEKTSAADWTMTTAITGFTGDFDIRAGVVAFGTSGVFGKCDNSADMGSVYVRDGATLSFAPTAANKAAADLNYRTLHLAGVGKDGRGAAEFTSTVYDTDNNTARRIVLDADAKVGMKSGSLTFIANNYIDLNGFGLSFGGSGTFTVRGQVKGEGEVILPTTSVEFGVRTGTVVASATDPFVFKGGKFVFIEYTTRPVNRPAWICGTGNQINFRDSWNSGKWQLSTNYCTWAGPIVFTNETGVAELGVSGNVAKHQLSFVGPISGKGKVTVASGNTSRIYFAGRGCTYTGGFVMAGGNVAVRYPDSLPDYSTVSCTTSHIDVVFDKNDPDCWTMADFAKLANEATWSNNTFPAMDVTAYDEIPTIDMQGGITNSTGFGAGGTVRLTNFPTGDDAGNFFWRAGTAIVSGEQKVAPKEFRVTNGQCTFLSNSLPATVVLDGGVEMEFGKTPARVGYGDANSYEQLGRLVVSNAFLHAAADVGTVWEHGYDHALAVGCNGGRIGGVLEVCDGAVVSNKLLVSGWGANPVGGDGRGMVIQRGGKVYSLGATSATEFGPGLGMAGHGVYQMLGGEFTALGSFHIGGYSMGAWQQFGGVATFTNYPGSTAGTFDCAAIRNGGWGELYLAGGTANFCKGFSFGGTWNAVGNQGKVQVNGPTAFLDVHGSKVETNSRSETGIARLTLSNGGVMRAAGLVSAKAKSQYPGSVFTVGFDGGVFRCGASGYDIFSADDATHDKSPNVVSVHTGGITVDTDGKTGNSTGVDLVGATGGGVQSVPFDPAKDQLANGSSGRNLIPPFVSIVGDGQGAAAVALFDLERGMVTNILMTCPGVGYSVATAKLYIARGAVKSIPCVVGENPKSGAFTKRGLGDFTLKGTNSWEGATVLEGGTLVIAGEKALPAGTTIVPKGGVLEATAEFFPTAMTVDVSGLDPEAPFAPFARVTSGTLESEPTFTIVGSDNPNWAVTQVGNTYRAGCRKGMRLILR